MLRSEGEAMSDRVIRTYDVHKDLHAWIAEQAAANKRAVVRQVEVFLEEARQRDIEAKAASQDGADA